MAQADFFIRQGDTASALTDTLADADGAAVDIADATITFTLVPVAGGAALLNAAAASNDQNGDGSDGSKGQVSYAWQAGDTDTSGFYLGTWEVTFSGGAVQTYPNAGYILVYISPDQPTTVGQDYLTVEEFKRTVSLANTTYGDGDAQLAVTAASRAIDLELGRRFYPDDDANQIRYYSPLNTNRLFVDDIVTITEVATDRNGGTAFADVWAANSDYVAEPLNAAADGWPFTRLVRNPSSSLYFPCQYPRSVRVTAKFGWATPPQPVKAATTLVASRLLQRVRVAPFGLVALGVEGAILRASSFVRDPEIMLLLGPYSRNSGLA